MLIMEIYFRNNKASGGKKKAILNKRYTPAITMVAACISAETGVGPSIASGNQTCNGNCADLAITAIRMAKLAKYKAGKSFGEVCSITSMLFKLRV